MLSVRSYSFPSVMIFQSFDSLDETGAESAFLTISIGDHVLIGENSVVEAISIGSYVYIGKDCVIGERCMIKDCSFIEDGAVIPSDTIVAPFKRYAGNPVQVVGEIFESTIETMRDMTIKYYESLHNTL